MKMTLDRSTPDPPILTVEQLSPRMHLTPEGFLLCEAVPIARTGDMKYGPGEVPVAIGPDGFAHLKRDAEELFSEETIASCNGKPVVDEHPEGGEVTPDNWQRLAKGHMLNARQGEDDLVDCLIADLLITDRALIASVQSGKREVSCGYEADYADLGGGQGLQYNIIMNHVALVERGRCGPRCAIGDHDPTVKEIPMSKKRVSLADKIRQTFKDAGESLATEMAGGSTGDPDADLSGGGDPDASGQHIHVHINGGSGGGGASASGDSTKTTTQDEPGAGEGEGEGGDPLEQRVANLENLMKKILAKLGGGGEGEETKDEFPPKEEGEEEEGEGEGEEEAPPKAKVGDSKGKKTQDSAALQTSYQQMLADAEILVPGFRVPTFDASSARKKTVDTMCQIRRSALGHVAATADGKAMIDALHAGPELDKLDCTQTAALFKAAAGAKKLMNNRTSTGDSNKTPPILSTTQLTGTPAAISEINRRNKEFWARQNGEMA